MAEAKQIFPNNTVVRFCKITPHNIGLIKAHPVILIEAVSLAKKRKYVHLTDINST
jgi:hypothetical protein